MLPPCPPARVVDALRPVERMFLYMPFQHTENRERQDESVEVWKALAAGVDDAALADYFEGSIEHAREHRDIVRRFGRFPHRNAAWAGNPRRRSGATWTAAPRASASRLSSPPPRRV